MKSRRQTNRDTRRKFLASIIENIRSGRYTNFSSEPFKDGKDCGSLITVTNDDGTTFTVKQFHDIEEP